MLAWSIADASAPIVPGDRLQITYDFWLWHDAVAGGGQAPWTDPQWFGADGGSMTVLFGWPIELYTLPISLVWGPVAAYKAALYAGFLLAALFTAAWVHSLGVTRVAAGAPVHRRANGG
jgi:hypothetical protein